MRLFNILLVFIALFVITGCTDNGCCKVCKKGKACGDTCISKDYTCTKGDGCACNGFNSNSRNLAPIVTTNQMFTLSGIEYKSGSENGCVTEDGYFNEEENQETKFIILGEIYSKNGDTKTSSLSLEILLEQPSNMLRLLITLDTDNYLYNGINISNDINYDYDTKCVDVMMNEKEFENSECVNYILDKYSNVNKLVSMEIVNDFVKYHSRLVE